MLEIRGVSFAYDEVAAVRDVTATIRSKQLVALTGPNGSGKSTLLKMLARVNVPDAGSGNCSHFASYHVWHYWHLKFWENSISRSHQDQQADYSELASGNGNPVRLIQIKRYTSMTPVGSSTSTCRELP